MDTPFKQKWDAEKAEAAQKSRQAELDKVVNDALESAKQSYKEAWEDGKISPAERQRLDRADNRVAQADTRMRRQGFVPTASKQVENKRTEAPTNHKPARCEATSGSSASGDTNTYYVVVNGELYTEKFFVSGTREKV